MEEIISRLSRIEEMLTVLVEREPVQPVKEIMNTNEVAEYLGLSVQRIRTLTSKGEIPHYKHANTTRNTFKRAEIDAWRTQTRCRTNRELEIEVATRAACDGFYMGSKK